MAPARPSSPTSLLWAYQLKKEHGFLLNRMQDLESANEKQENRIKSAENAAKTNATNDVEELAKKIEALNGSGIKERLSNVEKDVACKFDDMQADSEAMTLQIAALQTDERVAEEERKKSFNKDKALLKRIGDVEEGLKKYEKSLDLVGKQVNEVQFEQIKQQLDSLTEQVKKEGSQMKMLSESVMALEAANEELRKANEKLEREVRERKETSADARATKRAVSVESGAGDEDGTEKVAKKAKKSHKWSGGGADKDIIRMGSGSAADTPPKKSAVANNPADVAKSVSVPKQKPPPKPKPKPQPQKAAIPKSPLNPGEKRKRHKWSGGGADKDIIAAGMSGASGRKRDSEKRDEVVKPKNEPHKSNVDAGGKEIIRSGRGWYEVPRTPTPESQASSEPTKRSRGRPRKYPKKPSQVQLADENDKPLPKRGRGRPRKLPTLRDDEKEILARASESRQTRTQVQAFAKEEPLDEELDVNARSNCGEASTKSGATHGRPGGAEDRTTVIKREADVYSVSPSPPPGADAGRGHAAPQYGMQGVITSQPEQQPSAVAPKPKRRMIQLDDDISDIIRQVYG